MWDMLRTVSAGLTAKYPDGHTPFQIMTRLLEDCGELAQQVNHFEGSGIKRQKYGSPDRQHLAHEVTGALACLLELVAYYGIEQELAASVALTYTNLKQDGFLPEVDDAAQ